MYKISLFFSEEFNNKQNLSTLVILILRQEAMRQLSHLRIPSCTFTDEIHQKNVQTLNCFFLYFQSSTTFASPGNILN